MNEYSASWDSESKNILQYAEIWFRETKVHTATKTKSTYKVEC